MSEKIGQRGKSAEEQVKEALTETALRIGTFDWERRYDARSSGGRIPAQKGDYGVYTPRWHGLIEVKSIKHDYRLPAKNFEKKQRNRLRLRELCGGRIAVFVLHTESGLWRSPPFNLFMAHPDAASWDLREYPTYTSAQETLDAWLNRMQ